MSCHKLKDWNLLLACVGFPVIKEVVSKPRYLGRGGGVRGNNIPHGVSLQGLFIISPVLVEGISLPRS